MSWPGPTPSGHVINCARRRTASTRGVRMAGSARRTTRSDQSSEPGCEVAGLAHHQSAADGGLEGLTGIGAVRHLDLVHGWLHRSGDGRKAGAVSLEAVLPLVGLKSTPHFPLWPRAFSEFRWTYFSRSWRRRACRSTWSWTRAAAHPPLNTVGSEALAAVRCTRRRHCALHIFLTERTVLTAAHRPRFTHTAPGLACTLCASTSRARSGWRPLPRAV